MVDALGRLAGERAYQPVPGLLIATVGVDAIYGAERFAFGVPFLQDGIEFLLVMVGAYGIGEVLTRMHTGFAGEVGRQPRRHARASRPRFRGWRSCCAIKGTFAARHRRRASRSASCRARERRCRRSSPTASRASTARTAYTLGNGAPEGIVAAKSAATASVGGALVPLLAMGIPGSGATAIILAAFLLHGIQPGPQVFVSSTALIYTVFAAVFVGVIGMCILGYFAIKPLCKVLDAPEAIVSAFVVVFCFVGAFAARNNLPDLYVIAAFGLVGFLFERFKFPIAPLVLGTILGPLDREQLHDDDGELRQRLDGVLHASDQRHDPRALDHRAARSRSCARCGDAGAAPRAHRRSGHVHR